MNNTKKNYRGVNQKTQENPKIKRALNRCSGLLMSNRMLTKLGRINEIFQLQKKQDFSYSRFLSSISAT